MNITLYVKNTHLTGFVVLRRSRVLLSNERTCNSIILNTDLSTMRENATKQTLNRRHRSCCELRPSRVAGAKKGTGRGRYAVRIPAKIHGLCFYCSFKFSTSTLEFYSWIQYYTLFLWNSHHWKTFLTQIFILLQLKQFSFNKKISIHDQLQLKLFSFNTNIHSTSTQTIFIQ